MPEFWEANFTNKQLIWGLAPSLCATLAAARFARLGVKEVLIPGVGYGRNAKVFLEHGMSVTGIEISQTAIGLARSELGLNIPIHHGSVADMPFDHRQYGGIFCHGLLYLLDPSGRAKLLRDCGRQLRPGGQMVFTLMSKKGPLYGQGTRLGDDWYEIQPGVPMYFFDAQSAERELSPYGQLEITELDEPSVHGGSFPFLNVVCTPP
jgi:SAM-dependent methyltransferase